MDGNLAMNSHFENMSVKDSNDMADHYITMEGNKLIRSFMDHGVLAVRLQYHSSWNDLMPVVEKICDTPMADFINEEAEDSGYSYPITFGMRNEIGRWMVRFRGHGLFLGDTLIEAAWNACVDFIKSYKP